MADGREIRILYVDDEETLHEPVKQLLEISGGFTVETAKSAADILEGIEEGDYDAIISDYQMPGIDGLEFLDRLRKKSISTLFILFTGRGREEVAIEALNRGADYYFQKGTDIASQIREMRNIIQTSVERRRAEEEIRATRELLESFVQNTDDAIILFDTEGRIMRTNPSFRRIYGWDESEALGMRLPMVPEDDMARVENYFRSVVETGKPVTYRGKRIRKDGTFFDSLMTVSPVRDASGRVIAISGIGRDISEFVRLTEEIENQNEWLRTTISSIGDALIATDGKGKILFLNTMAEKLTGYTKQEAVGRHVSDIFSIISEKTKLPAEIPVDRVMATGTIVGLANHTALVSRDGRIRSIKDSAAPIIDSGKRVIGTVMVFSDVTSERIAQRALNMRFAVTSLLASASSIERAGPSLLSAMCEAIEWQAAEIWLSDRSNSNLRLLCQYFSPGIDPEPLRGEAESAVFARGGGVQGIIWKTGKPVWSDRLEDLPAYVRKAAARASGLVSLYGFPIRSGDQCMGAMLFYGSISKEIEEHFRSVMEDIGKQIGQFISKQRVDEDLRSATGIVSSLMENASDSIVIIDMQDRIISVNPAFERMFGWKLEEIAGRQLPAIPAPLRNIFEDAVEKVKKGGFVKYETKRLKRDGGDINVSVSLFPLRGNDGKIAGIASITRDISDMARLRDELMLHDAALRASPYIFMTVGNGESGRRVIYCNPAFFAFSKLDEENVIHRDFSEVFSHFAEERTVRDIEKMMLSGKHHEAEFELNEGSAGKTWMDIDVSPIFNVQKKIEFWILGMRNVSDEVRFREELKKLNEKLNLMGEMVRHDIKNGLQSILTYAESAIVSKKEDVILNCLSEIKNSVGRINRQLETFRDYQESVGAGAEWIDVHSILKTSLSGFDLKKITVEINLPEFEIYATPLVERVFHNLIDNSLRHGKNVTTIRFAGFVENGFYKIIYEDDGVGLSLQKKEQIFSQREGIQVKHGMQLARELIEITGITIRETGEPGKGARFEISIPPTSFRAKG
jgi:PAS domain S-box-containing protein